MLHNASDCLCVCTLRGSYVPYHSVVHEINYRKKYLTANLINMLKTCSFQIGTTLDWVTNLMNVQHSDVNKYRIC